MRAQALRHACIQRKDGGVPNAVETILIHRHTDPRSPRSADLMGSGAKAPRSTRSPASWHSRSNLRTTTRRCRTAHTSARSTETCSAATPTGPGSTTGMRFLRKEDSADRVGAMDHFGTGAHLTSPLHSDGWRSIRWHRSLTNGPVENSSIPRSKSPLSNMHACR